MAILTYSLIFLAILTAGRGLVQCRLPSVFSANLAAVGGAAVLFHLWHDNGDAGRRAAGDGSFSE